MNIIALKLAAERFEFILLQQIGNGDKESEKFARAIYSGIYSLVDKAKNEEITHPMEGREIFGSYVFVEDHIRKYKDLESAFAEFYMQLIGGDL